MHNFAKHPTEAASLARVWQHTQDRNIGLITAFQGTNEPQENRTRNAELATAIHARFGYLKVKGRHTENYDTPEVRPIYEESFLVIGKAGPDSGNLLGFLKQQGEKYGQDSILFKPHDDENAYLYGTNREKPDRWPGYGARHSVGPWHPNRMSEFHTVLFPGKSFSFEAAMANPRAYEKIGFYKQRTFFSRGEEAEF